MVRVLGCDPVTRAPTGCGRSSAASCRTPALPDRLRVAEAVELFAPPGHATATELLERFGLARRRRSAFAALSGGERQRLFLVLALLNRPAAGDPRRADPGPRPGRPARRLVGDLPAARRRHDRAAGHPRAGRGRGAVRPGRGDARRAGARRGHARRAGRPARRWATVRFSCRTRQRRLLDQLSRLPGVRDVDRSRGRSPSAATGRSSRTSATARPRRARSRPTSASRSPTSRPRSSPCSTSPPPDRDGGHPMTYDRTGPRSADGHRPRQCG